MQINDPELVAAGVRTRWLRAVMADCRWKAKLLLQWLVELKPKEKSNGD